MAAKTPRRKMKNAVNKIAQIATIDEAISRIRNGKFGDCKDCGIDGKTHL